MSEPTTRVNVPGTADRAYDLHVEAGALARLGGLCRSAAPAFQYAVVADSRVGELYGSRAVESLVETGARAELITFPAGEWNKSREEWAGITDRLLHRGYGRDMAVVALGGGVTGDLAGFVAATYMRGVPVVQVPTTLLAMFDSAIGGKTGVDTEAGKNLVGAFHHPALVVIDPELLATLPRMQRIAGLAEAVKTAAVADADLFEWLEEVAECLVEGDASATREAIDRVVRHKAAVVGADPVESARRAILNFGHTIGHALELIGGFEVLHGEAVAAGMRVEASLGEHLDVTEPGTADRLAALLAACGLDSNLESEHPPRLLWEATARDKKARDGEIRCVLLHSVGQVARDPYSAWTHQIPDASGEAWLTAALRPG
jgi:3-dehydroquinate synthase